MVLSAPNGLYLVLGNATANKEWRNDDEISKLLFWSFLLTFTYAIAVNVGIRYLPASNMRFWGVRAVLFLTVGWCCLVHFAIATCYLFMRKWSMSLFAFSLFLLLLGATIVEGLSIGPDIETIRRRTAEATGIPTSDLVCVGGRLSRESIVVFKATGDALLECKNAVRAYESNVRPILTDVLNRMDVNLEENSTINVLKFPMDYNTVFALCINDEWWIVFFGNAVM